ncbi:unnamed protein product [Spirodela intermedia]|uniref:Alkyl transferase n=2 Tax=Spirodela intermedia TaxID=51605 RepID=A0A7I8KJT1_SPIIN|nr:unnamed protein product [Spirodela intermedia]
MLTLLFPSPSCRPRLPLGGHTGGCSVVAPEGRWRPRRVAGREDQLDGSPPGFGGIPLPRLSGCRVPPSAAASSAGSSFVGAREEAYKRRLMEPPEAALVPFPPGLTPELMPRHVAFIMDGNSRWAKERGLPTSAGHEAGYRSLREIVRLSSYWGIKVLTVFAFSSENWLRPKTEVDFLMRLFEGVIRENLEDFKRQGIRLCIIGDATKLPPSLQKLAMEAAEVTRENAVIELLVAVSYSGRSDIVQACQKIAQRVKDGTLEPADITEAVIEEELVTNCIINSPYPDLLIRTSGELRLSNFLLWQSAYSELYFSKSLWPDFGEAEYVDALSSFQQRQRRFGLRT